MANSHGSATYIYSDSPGVFIGVAIFYIGLIGLLSIIVIPERYTDKLNMLIGRNNTRTKNGRKS